MQSNTDTSDPPPLDTYQRITGCLLFISMALVLILPLCSWEKPQEGAGGTTSNKVNNQEDK